MIVPADAHQPGADAMRRTPATTGPAGQEKPNPAHAPGAAVPVWSRVRPIVLVAWIVGCLAILVRTALGQMAVARLVKRSPRDVSRAWAPSLAAAADSVGIRRVVRIFICPTLGAPVTSGVVRPVILLPVDADEWPEERRRAVLVHELAHIARADYVTQLIGLFACALIWFHPLVWFALARLRAEAEGAADDRVLASGMSAIEYASHLLNLARGASGRSLTTAVAVGVVSTSHLERRFRVLLDATRSRAAVSPRLRTVAASLTLAIVVPVAGLHVGTRPRMVERLRSDVPPVAVTPPAAGAASVPTSTPSATPTRTSLITVTRGESASCEKPDSVAFRVQGNVGVAQLRAVVGIVPGTTVTQWMLARTIRALYATKTVDEHISTVCDTIASRAVLVFNVRDRGSSGVRADTSLRVRAADRSTRFSVPLDEIVAVIDDQAITRFDVQQRVRAKIQRKEVPEPTLKRQ